MKNPLFSVTFCCSILFFNVHCQTTQHNHQSDKIKGLTLVAPHQPFKNEPMTEVKSVGADWIAIVPYAFTRNGTPSVFYGGRGRQDWGESYEGVGVTVDSARRAGVKVMLKPQVWVGGGWIGGLDFTADADWEKWEKDYENYILPFAQIADSLHVELFCIGTEIKIADVLSHSFLFQCHCKTAQRALNQRFVQTAKCNFHNPFPTFPNRHRW